MGITTGIEWCDSTANLQMGCDGCELWNGRDRLECYAGELVNRHGGQAGWPDSFDEPKLFPHRLQEILKWSDLTGTKRPEKPWLDGLPRVVFLDDLGDTFTPSLPKDWLAEHLPALGASPHVYVLLTKQAREMAEFSKRHPLPENFWPGVSVTSQDFEWRLRYLREVRGGSVRVISAEPLHGPLDIASWLEYFGSNSWLIAGGSSGNQAHRCEIDWIQSLVTQGSYAAARVFVKQVGGNLTDADLEACARATGRSMHHKKGGDPAEWPKKLRVRQVPAWARRATA